MDKSTEDPKQLFSTHREADNLSIQIFLKVDSDHEIVTYPNQSALILSQNDVAWHKLTGKQINNKTVILCNYGDIHLFHDGPIFMANKVYINHCDKNFIFYWINKQYFPNIKELYILSHPCEPSVLQRDISYIYLSDKYKKYKEGWVPNYDNVKIIEDSVMIAEVNNYKPEQIISNDISCD